MTFNFIRTGVVAIGLSAGIATAASAVAQQSAHGDPKLAALAEIKPEAARDIAIDAQPGTIKDWELEMEGGGSGLRYSFDIDVNGVAHEVGVDAANGKVLENVVESATDEAREADQGREGNK